MERILILGAGYGGLRTAALLGRRLGRNTNTRITLVNDSPRHVLTTELHKVAAGVASPEDVSFRLDRVLRNSGVEIRLGRVTRIRPAERRVDLDHGTVLAYDRLVVALGSVVEYWGIPGLKEHSVAIGGLRGAMEIHRRVEEARRRAAEAGREARVLIGGGGLTGVEVAGELALAAGHPAGRLAAARVTLLEMAPQVLPGLPDDLRRKAAKLLERYGVEIHTGVGIREATAENALLTDGRELPYDVLVWAGGVRGNPVVAEAFATDPRDRAYVDLYLRAEGHGNVYIIGDTALAMEARTGNPVAPTAQAALQQAETVAAHIAQAITGTPRYVPPYEGRLKGVLVSVGPHQGLGEFGGMRGSGWLWKRLKDINDFRYRTQVRMLA